ncbi:hypothetical protein VU01_12344 [Candidatus Electrothrix marina]|uniref:Uncharacterized protein n=1 Tax=Candidatus Electrothrix marina TaxID=1859130 RepID=A0A444JD50_9BACT|nr:hypothetical protein VU01_12344 [Candidatus Electrothrix marina]
MGYSIRTALYQSDLTKIFIALFLIGIVISVYQGLLESLGTRIIRKISTEPSSHEE